MTKAAPFPTCVGMNRVKAAYRVAMEAVPHMRGDEPRTALACAALAAPFPTCVGMNRGLDRQLLPQRAVPHMRGDEPYREDEARKQTDRSPHAWG